MTYNTQVKEKRTKQQAIIYKKLHRKPNTEQHEPNYKQTNKENLVLIHHYLNVH